MSYDTNNIMKDLDITKPDGASEYGSILDNAMKEVKRIMFYGSSVTAVSSYPYTVLITDNTLYCTGAGGTVAAPQLSTISTTGVEKRIVVINDSSGSVTFDAYSTETVGGSLTYTIVAGAIAEFLAHGGTDWEVFATQAIYLYDGTAYRSASATPAANTIPVSGSDSKIARGFLPFGGALVYQTSSQSIPSGGANINFPNENYDTHGFHDNVTNNTRITIPSGVTRVRLTASCSLSESSTSGVRFMQLYKNGNAAFVGGFTDQRFPVVAAGQHNFVGTSAILTVTAGDYFELQIYQNSGGAQTLNGAAGNWLSIEVIE